MRGKARNACGKRRERDAALVALAFCLWPILASAGAPARPGSHTAIWFAPLDPLRRPFGVKGPDDFDQAFADTRDWPVVASRVSVVQLYTYYVLHAADAELKRVFAFLRAHHMMLSLEVGVLPASKACGLGVEGYDGKLLMQAADRLSALGGALRFVAMDEPLWHGVHYTGVRACHATPETVAGQAADAINELHARYPGVEVGQIEPFPVADISGWQDELLRWADQVERLSHRRLAFFHADITHTLGVAAAVRALQAAYHAHSIPFGYIDTGSSLEQSEAAWAKEASDVYTEMDTVALDPDSIVFETWANLPNHILAESDPLSLTGIIRAYLRSPSQLSARRSGTSITLRLTDDAGQPLPDKQVRLEALTEASPGTSQGTISGVVPDNAVTALWGIRGNVECGGCMGSGRVRISNAVYGETAASRRDGYTREAVFPSGFDAELIRDQPLRRNSTPFRVAAGRIFMLRYEATSSPGAAGAGYVCVIFQDADGREISRFKDWLRPQGKSLSSVKTDGAGVATLRDVSRAPLQFDFAGDAADRPSRFTLN